jgi:hypothetical protein
MSLKISGTLDDSTTIENMILVIILIFPWMMILLKRTATRRKLENCYTLLKEQLELVRSDSTEGAWFSKHIRPKRIRYAATLDKLIQGETFEFFQTACDLAFSQNGSFFESNGSQYWKSISSNHLEVKLTPGETRTEVELTGSHLHTGYMFFILVIFPLSYLGLSLLIHLFTGASTGTGLTLFINLALPAVAAVSVWLGYKKRKTLMESGFMRLLIALKNLPARGNMNLDEYNSAVIANLPRPKTSAGIFSNYVRYSSKLLIKPGMDKRHQRDIEKLIEDVSDKYYGFESDGYLYRSGLQEDVQITFIPGNNETIVEFRSSGMGSNFPLGILTGVCAALSIFWLYFLGYGYVVEFGPASETAYLAIIGIFGCILLSVVAGLCILLVRKIFYAGIIAKTAPQIIAQLDSHVMKNLDSEP